MARMTEVATEQMYERGVLSTIPTALFKSHFNEQSGEKVTDKLV